MKLTKPQYLLVFIMIGMVSLLLSCRARPFENIEFKIIDSLSISTPVPKNFEYSFHHVINHSTPEFILYSPLYKEILRTNRKKDQFFLDTMFQLTNYLEKYDDSFFWHYINEDSIFILKGNSLPYQFFLIDNEGNELRHWTFKEPKEGDDYTFIKPNSSNDNFHYIPEYKEFVFHIHNQFYTKIDSANFNLKSRKLSVWLDSDTVRTNYTFGRVPEKKQHLFLGYFGEMRSTLFGNQIVCSYDQSDNIQVYQKGKLIGQYYAGAKKFKERTTAFDYRKSNDRAYIPEIMYNADSYRNILSNGEYIYRICIRRKKDSINADGSIKYTPIIWSIVILDQNFKYLGEADFSGNNLNFNNVFPMKGKKILIQSSTGDKYYIYELDL